MPVEEKDTPDPGAVLLEHRAIRRTGSSGGCDICGLPLSSVCHVGEPYVTANVGEVEAAVYAFGYRHADGTRHTQREEIPCATCDHDEARKAANGRPT